MNAYIHGQYANGRMSYFVARGGMFSLVQLSRSFFSREHAETALQVLRVTKRAELSCAL